MRAKKALVMNGGGTESAKLLSLVEGSGREAGSCFIRASYPAAGKQGEAARRLAARYGVPHREVTLDFGVDVSHVWTDGVTRGPATGWTAIVFGIGVALGRGLGDDEVWFGQTVPNAPVVEAFDAQMQAAVGRAVVWRPEMSFPLEGTAKADLGLPREVVEMTYSCFSDPACGACVKCRGREEALDAAV